MQIDGALKQMHPMHFLSAPLSPAFSIQRRHRADSSSKDVVHHPLVPLSLTSCLPACSLIFLILLIYDFTRKQQPPPRSQRHKTRRPSTPIHLVSQSNHNPTARPSFRRPAPPACPERRRRRPPAGGRPPRSPPPRPSPPSPPSQGGGPCARRARPPPPPPRRRGRPRG